MKLPVSNTTMDPKFWEFAEQLEKNIYIKVRTTYEIFLKFSHYPDESFTICKFTLLMKEYCKLKGYGYLNKVLRGMITRQIDRHYFIIDESNKLTAED